MFYFVSGCKYKTNLRHECHWYIFWSSVKYEVKKVLVLSKKTWKIHVHFYWSAKLESTFGSHVIFRSSMCHESLKKFENFSFCSFKSHCIFWYSTTTSTMFCNEQCLFRVQMLTPYQLCKTLVYQTEFHTFLSNATYILDVKLNHNHHRVW